MAGTGHRKIGTAGSRALHLAAVLAAAFAAAPAAKAVPVAYRDINGVWHHIDSKDWPKSPNAVVHRLQTKRGGGIFITYDDLPGHGFNAGGGLGADRQARAEAAAAYIGSLLNESGRLDIEFTRSVESGPMGALAFAGPLYDPNDFNPHFDPGSAFKHIKNGSIDPFPGSPDITATVDFRYPWNSSTNPTPNTMYDLQSVLTHEFTHGLGFLTLVDANGNSLITGGNPGVFSTFDNLLYTGNANKLFDDMGGARFARPTSDLTGGDNGVLFGGPITVNQFGGPPIYAPSSFQPISSLSHWDDDSFAPPKPLMVHLVFKGPNPHAYADFELTALQDLGYNLILPVVPAQSGPGLFFLAAAVLLTAAVAAVLRRRRA
jgi:hypothetical protein